MNKIQILIVIILGSCSVGEHKIAKQYYANGVVKCEFEFELVDSDTVLNGIYNTYYENGNHCCPVKI